MYEDLVDEYLSYEIPEYVFRPSGDLELPRPRVRNLIHSIIGVRRCGKTFCLLQNADALVKSGTPREKVFYFAFDDDRLGVTDEHTASEALEAYYRLVPSAREGCYLLFDEIQDIPNWEGFVRRVAERENVTLVITGSSSKLLSTDIPTKLRGRSIAFEMWPLDFGEFCTFNDIGAAPTNELRPMRQRNLLVRAFGSYLEKGGFPAVQGLDQTTRSLLLQSYADEIVTKDVLERFGSASFRAGRRFALTALRSTGLKFSVNKQVNAMRSAGIALSNESAYGLLDDLEDAHLVFKLADYTLSVRDNPKSSYKAYSIDPGLSLAVAPANHVDLGQRLETAVFLELKRRHGANRENVIARYSSAACPEVDFVVGDVMLSAEYELIQVAAESGASRGQRADASPKFRSEVGNLEKAMAETGLRESTLVTLEEEDEVRTDAGDVRIVPAWKWFLG